MTIWRMRVERWITNATNTHSEYVRLNTFPRQQRLHERAPILGYTYSACLVMSSVKNAVCCSLLSSNVRTPWSEFLGKSRAFREVRWRGCPLRLRWVEHNNLCVWGESNTINWVECLSNTINCVECLSAVINFTAQKAQFRSLNFTL